jgi:hypothetical protein
MNRANGRNEIGLYTDKNNTLYYTASINEMNHSSRYAEIVQVSFVACTDLLANL